MSAIITNVSSVSSFVKDTVSEYNQIVSLANAALSRINDMTVFVEGEKEKLEKQMIQLSQMEEDLITRIRALKNDIDNTSSAFDYYSDQYYRADNSDDAASYRSRMEEARSLLNSFKESFETATQIQKEIEQRKQQFQQLFRAISAMIDALKNNTQEVKKYLSFLDDEVTYNSQALSTTLNALENYISSIPIVSLGIGATSRSSYAGTSAVSSSSSSSSSNETKRKTEEYKAKKYRIKSGSFGFNSDGTRPLLRVYHPYSAPVKSMLYEAMKCMHNDFREAVMKHLGGVIFLSAKHGFNYTKDSRGRMIRIIGIDASSPDFSRLLLIHVGHHLYSLDKTKEKLSLDRSLAKELARNINSSNKNIQKLANSFSSHAVGSEIRTHKSIAPAIKSPGSKFFSQCFRAYVSQDYEFLSAVKSNFGESYRSFEEIISRLPNK